MSFRDKFHDTVEIVHLKVERANAKLNPHSPDHFAPASHAESARVYAEVISTVNVTEQHKETWTHQGTYMRRTPHPRARSRDQ